MKERRSRRRKGSHSKRMTLIVFRFVLILLVVAGLTLGGVYGFHFWQGSVTSSSPLESSREVVPETMAATSH